MTATREAIDAAHERLGTEPGRVPGVPGQQTIDGGEVRHQKDGGEFVESFPEEIRVDGTTQLSAFDMGGKRARSASIRLAGGKVMLVDGKAFSKGEVIHFSGTAVVREVGQRDKPDPKTGIVVDAEQKHVAEIVDLRIGE
jgi:hypothetical protein